MDLSLEISSALRLLGNTTNVGQAEFKKVLQKAIDDLNNSGKVPMTSTGTEAYDGADFFNIVFHSIWNNLTLSLDTLLFFEMIVYSSRK